MGDEGSKDFDYKANKEKYWPAFDVSLDLVCGSAEVGRDLYLLGNFGGFGGHLAYGQVHSSYRDALQAAKAFPTSSGISIFRLQLQPLGVFVTPEKKVIREWRETELTMSFDNPQARANFVAQWFDGGLDGGGNLDWQTERGYRKNSLRIKGTGDIIE